MNFSERLKSLRKREGLSQQEVAEKIGISLRAYAAYETQNVRPRKRETYIKLAEVLHCDVNELLVEDNTAFLASLFAGSGLLELGTSLKRPIGAAAATVFAPVAASILNWKKEGYTYDDWAREQNRLSSEYDKNQRKFSTISRGILLAELGKQGIRCQVGDAKDLKEDASGPDDYIRVDSPDIDEWWFVYWCAENRENEQFKTFNYDRAYMLFNRFGLTTPDPRRKASIVLNDKELFDYICTLKGRNSYRGNLTVILLDTEETRVLKEEVLSSFEADLLVDKLPVV